MMPDLHFLTHGPTLWVALGLNAAVLVLGLGYLLVALSPHLKPRDAMFEAVSALATVGLSTGVTAKFTDSGKYLLIALMFIGGLAGGLSTLTEEYESAVGSGYETSETTDSVETDDAAQPAQPPVDYEKE